MRPDPRGSYVYFIKPVGWEGPIKIGHSHIPFERLNVHMNWSPVKLEILTWAAGGRHDEQAIHAKFAIARKHCEWFDATPGLLRCIERVKEGKSLVEAFDFPALEPAPSHREDAA